ncbi:hypothetical protein NQ015_07655 [Corynebacterium sp. 153RC1]|uniref:hypothetical protein n=1 Tax=unclassified Corynebacterium TaxID=2624378 RepID=UPI00211BFA7B|nr:MULTISPECIES: hypothetical protein [unclassified Corynebacterium]MCQ9357244.1 hypothetical protein [Corynebacterium sp. 122RC1]MCQ9361641.1 hypothetical protein [Corynebacterium sp. 153RC1]MCQ9352799.1 hypothetical protein [Corynebacterium sp. 209RC1]MCQ9354983.1 hypothetical protein [Corynebacterium sp. 1222RC1]MCQ9359419.1 hypothetical protein [Corynebacterium sp. 142RC1]
MAPAPSKGIAPTDAPKATAEPSGPAATVKKVAQGALANTGAYAFDLREGWTDANGTLHTFDAVANEYVRVWIEDFTTESGNRAIRGNVWYETFRLRMSSPQEGGENTGNQPDVG